MKPSSLLRRVWSVSSRQVSWLMGWKRQRRETERMVVGRSLSNFSVCFPLLPPSHPSGTVALVQKHHPLTVAGPHRHHTGFPITPDGHLEPVSGLIYSLVSLVKGFLRFSGSYALVLDRKTPFVLFSFSATHPVLRCKTMRELPRPLRVRG